MFQIKYSCSCGKRILAPTTHLHQTKPCPRCHQSVKIPGFGEPSFLLMICDCGEAHSLYGPHCPKCKRPFPENMKPQTSPNPNLPPSPAPVESKKELSPPPIEPEKEALPALKKEESPQINKNDPVVQTLKEPVTPQKSPEGFRSGIKMKMRCSCGKRMLVWTRNIGKEETCPKCQHSVKIPPSTASNVLHFVCDCGTFVSVREDICVSCQKDLKETTPSAESPVPKKDEVEAPVPDSDTTDLSGIVSSQAEEEKKI